MNNKLSDDRINKLLELYQNKYSESPLDYAIWLAINELKEYKNLEKQGAILKLPCKFGDIVYSTDKRIFFNEIDITKPIKCRVIHFNIKINWHVMVEVLEGYGMGSTYIFDANDFGKIVFLTQEEAENELKRLESAE